MTRLRVWFQPSGGGNVVQEKDFKAEGSHLSVTVTAAAAARHHPRRMAPRR